jgi:hypothetical protein
MGVTKYDNINAVGTSVRLVGALPVTPAEYYNAASNDVDSVTWAGGEMAFLKGDSRLYIQQNESGTTPEWKRLAETFATTTSTSTSTSTSSTTTS